MSKPGTDADSQCAWPHEMSQASAKDRAALEGKDILMPLLDLEIWSRKTMRPRTPAAERHEEAQRRVGQHHHDGGKLYLAQVQGGEDRRLEGGIIYHVEREYVIVHVLNLTIKSSTKWLTRDSGKARKATMREPGIIFHKPCDQRPRANPEDRQAGIALISGGPLLGT